MSSWKFTIEFVGLMAFAPMDDAKGYVYAFLADGTKATSHGSGHHAHSVRHLPTLWYHSDDIDPTVPKDEPCSGRTAEFKGLIKKVWGENEDLSEAPDLPDVGHWNRFVPLNNYVVRTDPARPDGRGLTGKSTAEVVPMREISSRDKIGAIREECSHQDPTESGIVASVILHSGLFHMFKRGRHPYANRERPFKFAPVKDGAVKTRKAAAQYQYVASELAVTLNVPTGKTLSLVFLPFRTGRDTRLVFCERDGKEVRVRVRNLPPVHTPIPEDDASKSYYDSHFHMLYDLFDRPPDEEDRRVPALIGEASTDCVDPGQGLHTFCIPGGDGCHC